MSELASSLHVDRSTATRVVDRLVAEGVAERIPFGGDRRGIVVRATGQGRLLCGLIVQGRRKALVEYLRDFSEEDVVFLGEFMQRLIGSVARVVQDRDGGSRLG
jgi:DNA-binding MarR family transcriptional regulator